MFVKPYECKQLWLWNITKPISGNNRTTYLNGALFKRSSFLVWFKNCVNLWNPYQWVFQQLPLYFKIMSNECSEKNLSRIFESIDYFCILHGHISSNGKNMSWLCKKLPCTHGNIGFEERSISTIKYWIRCVKVYTVHQNLVSGLTKLNPPPIELPIGSKCDKLVV